MKQEDARIINSKKFLKEALITLLTEQKLSKITIKDLCETAEINRATFYAHYKDIQQLFDDIIFDFMSTICIFINGLNEEKTNEERSYLFKKLVKFIDKNSSLFILIFENSNNVDLNSTNYIQLKNQIYQKINQKFDQNQFSSYVSNYFIYAGGGILYTWVKNGKKESYSEIVTVLYNLLIHGASYYTRKD